MPMAIKIKIINAEAIFLFIEMMWASRQVNTIRMGISATDNENNIEVFSMLLRSIIWNKMPSTCGSKKLNALSNKSCPNAKRAIETINVQMYIVLEVFNMLAAN